MHGTGVYVFHSSFVKTAVNSKQNNKFARASCYLYISLSFLHDYGVKMPNLTFFGERKQGTKFLSLSKLECGPQEINVRETCHR